MDFTLNEEQESLRETVRQLLAQTYGSSEDRRAVAAKEPGFSKRTWSQLAELGALALPFDEEIGGVGAGPMEVAIVSEEIGRVLALEPYTEAVVLAGSLITEQGSSEQAAEIIGGLVSGELLPIFAAREPGGRWNTAATNVQAEQREGQWVLSGTKEPVPFAGNADLFIVSAAIGSGTGLFLVEAGASGVSVTGYPTHDLGRSGRVTFVDAVATPLGAAGVDASDAIERSFDRARLAYAHEALGAMEFSVETTTAYLKTRKQFGVTLNNFQALTHSAAEMLVALELARSTIYWATIVRDAEHYGEQGTDVSTATSHAWLQAARASRFIGTEAVQLHGGIGVTAEYSIGHYLSRLTAIEHLVGDASIYRKRLAPSLTNYDSIDPTA